MLTLAAFYYHPDLDVARAEWQVTRARVITAGERPNPTIGITPQYDANSGVGVTPWTLGFFFDIPIETAGKRGYRVAQAEDLSEAARLNVAFVAWQVRSRVRMKLVNLYFARQQEALLKKQLAVQENLTEILEQRFTAGMLALSVITDARIARDKTQLALNEARREAAEAVVQLADTLGLPAHAIDGVEIKFDFIDRLPGDLPAREARRQALMNRPDIMASLMEYAASQSALQLEIAKQYPDIHLGPAYTWDQDVDKWALGFSVTLPVFNRNQGPIAEAEGHRNESAARFAALQAKVVNEIDRTLAGYRISLQAYKTARAILEEEFRRAKILRSRLKPGEASRFALANVDVSVISAELAAADALARTQKALGVVEDALQRPVDSGESVSAVQEGNPRERQELRDETKR